MNGVVDNGPMGPTMVVMGHEWLRGRVMSCQHPVLVVLNVGGGHGRRWHSQALAVFKIPHV